MPSLNLTHSRPKTSRLSRWLAAWRSGPALAALKSPAAEPALRVAVEPQNNRGADYEFFGRHLLASYVGCDPAALADGAGLKAAMERAIEASGATLIRSVDYSFSPNGMTAVMLLAESHASIHTYPEHQACFVDLFTCGRGCSAQKFDATLCQYLRPANVQRRTVLRHADGIEEASAGAECWLAEWAA